MFFSVSPVDSDLCAFKSLDSLTFKFEWTLFHALVSYPDSLEELSKVIDAPETRSESKAVKSATVNVVLQNRSMLLVLARYFEFLLN